MLNRPNISPEQLMALVQALILEVPSFPYEGTLNEADLKWLSRAETLIEASGATTDLMEFRLARKFLNTMQHSRTSLLLPLHNVYSRAELSAPASAQGAFIPPGDTWKGYAAIIKLVQRPCEDLVIIDPYVNADLFTDFAPHVVASNGLRCLTAKRNDNHPGLEASASRWVKDHPEKPVEVRYAASTSLHDRLIIIDSREVWLISQSLKDIAKRSPASVSKAEAELGLMKVEHYAEVWSQAIPIT